MVVRYIILNDFFENMNRKAKGTSAERELIHKFWKERWAAIRVAGSGSQRYPAPDLLVGNNIRKLAIEAKVTKAKQQYFTSKEIYELQEFAALFGVEPYVAVKFSKIDWFFLTLEDLEKTENNYVVSIPIAKRRGITFFDLVDQKMYEKSS